MIVAIKNRYLCPFIRLSRYISTNNNIKHVLMKLHAQQRKKSETKHWASVQTIVHTLPRRNEEIPTLCTLTT